jgi:hypothetical protein
LWHDLASLLCSTVSTGLRHVDVLQFTSQVNRGQAGFQREFRGVEFGASTLSNVPPCVSPGRIGWSRPLPPDARQHVRNNHLVHNDSPE